MAGITKEERLRRAAAAADGVDDNQEDSGPDEVQPDATVSMYIEIPEYPGGPTEADVHADQVEAWKNHGWRVRG